jgi:hypothetical protein
LVMMLANCFLTAFMPRFTFPMWELTIVSALFWLADHGVLVCSHTLSDQNVESCVIALQIVEGRFSGANLKRE